MNMASQVYDGGVYMFFPMCNQVSSAQLCSAHVQSWPVAIFSLQIYYRPGCGGSEWIHSPHGLVSQTVFYIPAICSSRNLSDRQLLRLAA